MSTKPSAKRPATSNDKAQEYAAAFDGVIELPSAINEKEFFDGLLDAVIEYIEKHHGLAALTMSHKPYTCADDRETDNNEGKRGRQVTENRQRVRSVSQKIRRSRQRTRR